MQSEEVKATHLEILARSQTGQIIHSRLFLCCIFIYYCTYYTVAIFEKLETKRINGDPSSAFFSSYLDIELSFGTSKILPNLNTLFDKYWVFNFQIG